MDFKISLDQLFKLLPDSQVEGSVENKHLNGIASLERAKKGDISFLGNPKYKNLSMLIKEKEFNILPFLAMICWPAGTG